MRFAAVLHFFGSLCFVRQAIGSPHDAYRWQTVCCIYLTVHVLHSSVQGVLSAAALCGDARLAPH